MLEGTHVADSRSACSLAAEMAFADKGDPQKHVLVADTTGSSSSGLSTFVQLAVVCAVGWYLARLYSRGQLRPFLKNLQARAVFFWSGFIKLLSQEMKRRRQQALAQKEREKEKAKRGTGIVASSSSSSSGSNSIELTEAVALSPLTTSPPQFTGLAPGEQPLLSPLDFSEIIRGLPSRLQGKVAKLAFSTSQHGYSLSTLYNCAKHYPQAASLVVLQDKEGQVFGGFAPRSWHSSTDGGYFGSGETFVFRAKPRLQLYRWTRGDNKDFLLAKGDLLAFGGSGFALALDEQLDRGWSSRSGTFDNPPLAGGLNMNNAAAAAGTAAVAAGSGSAANVSSSSASSSSGASNSNANGSGSGSGSVAAADGFFRAVRVELWVFVLPHELSAADKQGLVTLAASGSGNNPTGSMAVGAGFSSASSSTTASSILSPSASAAGGSGRPLTRPASSVTLAVNSSAFPPVAAASSSSSAGFGSAPAVGVGGGGGAGASRWISSRML